MPEHLTIERLGARGDGIARRAPPTRIAEAEKHAATIFIAGALPGEAVLAEVSGERGHLLAIETASPERRAPACLHFGSCGGCVAQHMAPGLYDSWKVAELSAALARAGLAVPVPSAIDAHGEGRRRVVLHVRPVEGAMRAGFMAARSHDLVPIESCPVLVPGLDRAPAVAAELGRLVRHLRKPLDVQATATEGGLDIDLRGLGAVDDATRLALAAAAERLDLARIALHGEVIVERRPPRIAFGRSLVVPPPGGFLQATAAGDETLARLVREACGKAKRVVDCFSGCGTFALRLAESADVHAVESEALALAALDRAARGTAGLRRVTTERRDLFRRPLLPPEIERFDAIVFDPPRAGAEALARQIAAARVPLAVAVSCDAGTFARDAALLTAGGFALESVTPVDQFRYSAHIEIVGVFRRPKAGRKR